jgi:hypothetical protein
MSAVTQPRTRSLDLSMLRGGRTYLWLAGVSLILAIVSLHWPSTPSYDPWSWLIWGREIHNWVTGSGPAANQALHIAGGSSWKPLPVIFTTVFAFAGSAQPNLWLVVARAGAALTVLVSAKLAMRITWSLVSRSGDEATASDTWGGRLIAYAPVAFAGAATLVCTTFTHSYPGNMLLGYSEGVMTAAFLIACERAWDGHHRQAFALGIIPCLDRPEIWPVWGLYGLWLMWRDREARRLVIGLAILMLALWVVPQKLGGGTVSGLATHAQGNHSKSSCVNASFPFSCELDYTLWPLVLERLEIASLILLGITGYQVTRSSRQLGSWSAALRQHPAAVAASLAGAFGFIWWLGISAETQEGFAGNPRYAIVGVMLVCISGAAGYGWACTGLARLAGAGLRRLEERRPGFGTRAPSWRVRLTAATTFMVLLFLFVPNWFAHRMPSVASIRYTVRYQAELRERMSYLINDYGGADKVRSCGSLMTNNFQVTMLAWYLDVPIRFVEALPVYKKGHLTTKLEAGPNVVFQDGVGSAKASDQGPTPAQMQVWEQGWKQKNGSSYKIIVKSPVTLYTDCSAFYIYNHKPRKS